MKKFLVALLLLSASFAFVGCQKSEQSLVKANMREITKTYYYAENDSFSVSISVGQRENPYLVDGVHHDTVDFSLIILKDKTNSEKEKETNCKLIVNGQSQDLKLVYNPIAKAFMFDLGYLLEDKDEVAIEFLGGQQNIPIVSKDFEISSSQAISVACKQFAEVLKNYTKAGKLFGECYLKVLGEQDENSQSLFWCFSFVGQDNKSFNIIISVFDGTILASDV